MKNDKRMRMIIVYVTNILSKVLWIASVSGVLSASILFGLFLKYNVSPDVGFPSYTPVLIVVALVSIIILVVIPCDINERRDMLSLLITGKEFVELRKDERNGQRW